MKPSSKSIGISKTYTDILMVDDEPDVCEVIRDGLRPHGFLVRLASNGRDSLMESLRGRPTAVLMDILMPGMSGIDALGIFKTIEPLRTVPVLMLTALKNKDDVMRSMRGGAADYIGKPFDLKDTAERVRRAIERPAPPMTPVFRHLRYTAAEHMDALQLRLDCELTDESADDLACLIRAIAPMLPIRIELDFTNVTAIEGRPIGPLASIKETVVKAAGEIVITGFDPKRHRPAQVGLIRNLFSIADSGTSPSVIKLDKVSKRDEKTMADALSMMSGLRFDVKSKSDHVSLDLIGELLPDSSDIVDRAFDTIPENTGHLIIRLDGVKTIDSRAMHYLVRRITEVKLNRGVKCYLVANRQEIQKSFRDARGSMVAGVYDQIESARSALRAGG